MFLRDAQPLDASDASAPAADAAAAREEAVALARVLRAFRNYLPHALAAVARRRSYLAAATDAQARQHLLLRQRPAPHDGSGGGEGSTVVGSTAEEARLRQAGGNVVAERLDRVEERVRRNARVLGDMLAEAAVEDASDGDGGASAAGSSDAGGSGSAGKTPPVLDADMDKVRSTLKQLVRDWGREGQAERDAAYAPVLDALEREFAHVPLQERGKIKVLVPGAGLGRLAFEIARAGFSSQGNEFSFYMLIASNYILNFVTQPSQFTIYPYVHSASNHPRAASQLAGVAIPDIAVRGAIPPTADFSMVAGDFIEVYGAPTSTDNGDSGGGGTEGGSWDVVATCFFVDTGRNVIEYLETIRHALRDGGLWINIGPLLYHFEDMRTESSVELTLEELKLVAQNLGFEFEEERMVRSTYTSNPESMLQYVYNCWFSVARVKRRPGAVVS